MGSDSRAAEESIRHDDLDALLTTIHDQLGIAVVDRLNAHGGPPELRTPELALDRLLAATHRSTGSAVSRRLSGDACAALAERNPALQAWLAARGPLARRPAAIRVKHREEALRLVHNYWPFDLAQAMRTAVRIIQDLCDLLGDSTQPLGYADTAMEQLREHLEGMSQLSEPHRPHATLTGLDYLDAVESVLADPAERLANELHSIRELLDEELAPAITALETTGRAYLFGVDAVAQDLIDDLAHGCEDADALARAVAEVERASNDFVGADLTNAKLEGVLLEGILWDHTTLWPTQWETRVRRASLPSDEEEGVLVVAAEESDSVIHAEA
ncbi:hypothetical protein OIE49_00745 [Streptomyces sp. NBC_01788]|uniref:hypothetical protein n=1 Tax=Streptomyces sp. NBC_01788 TaxID=2975940 RepID=UPI002DD7B09B|nr:hypothetical protein [Streptomyces sp. NBC_01788]WSB24567.1 hypothetical protein OIE49_00745 [Streptomyces sp. NBC_01788]